MNDENLEKRHQEFIKAVTTRHRLEDIGRIYALASVTSSVTRCDELESELIVKYPHLASEIMVAFGARKSAILGETPKVQELCYPDGDEHNRKKTIDSGTPKVA